jgi:di/tricarboxylate transporter
MFDFMPVGLLLTVSGIGFLTFGWRLLPRTRGALPGPESLFSVKDYQAEVRLPMKSPLVNKTVREFEELGEGDVTIAAIIREKHRYVPSGHWVLFPDDVLVLQCDAHALERVVAAAQLQLLHDKELTKGVAWDEDPAVVEAVVTPRSPMIGNTVDELHLR